MNECPFCAMSRNLAIARAFLEQGASPRASESTYQDLSKQEIIAALSTWQRMPPTLQQQIPVMELGQKIHHLFVRLNTQIPKWQLQSLAEFAWAACKEAMTLAEAYNATPAHR